MNKTSAAIVRTLLLGTSCLSAFAASPARANPTGGSVAQGTATITNRGNNSTVIDQKTGKVVINWDSFSIGAGGTVQFNQPGSSAIALNRVLGSQPTSIYGSLLANGQVWIINGNGILFGKGSQINVGGLIATTSDIKDGDFLAGNYSFSGGTGASVVNQGTIRTRNGGYAVLSGASASNQGLVSAQAGTVVIGGASAFTVDFEGDGLLRYAITAPAQTATNGRTGASNSGTISAAGGRVVMTARAASSVQDAVVNNTGMISATSAKVQNGEVILDGGDGDVSVSGTIDASGAQPGATGGSVTVTGRNIAVADGAKIDVSGDAGGGTVKIGGDLHGGGTTPHAANVTVGNATIKADAIHKGNGGTLVVWSDGDTDFSAQVSAKGGAAGGNGGQVETSGRALHVAPTATVATSAPRGTTGDWLLDPQNIVIATGGNTPVPPGGTLPANQDADGTDTIDPATVVAALGTTNVTLEAGSDITVEAPVLYSSSNALSLLAGGDITINASIQNSLGGAINLVAGWDGVTVPPASLTAPGVYGNNESGTVTIESTNGAVAVGSAGGLTTVAAGEIDIQSDTGYAQLGFHGAGGGDIDVVTSGDVGVYRGNTGDAMIGNGSFLNDQNGNVTGNISLNVGGTLLLTAGEGASTDHAWIGNAAGGSFTETGNVTVLIGTAETNTDIASMVVSDLTGGDFTLGVRKEDEEDVGGLTYTSAHNLTLLSTGDIEVSQTLANNGSGAITVAAGWDGVTTGLDALKTTPGAYGNSEATVTIGGYDADGDVFLGSKGGTTTILTGELDVDAEYGNAQLGYHGNGTGDIVVQATGDVNVIGGDPTDEGPYAMIGNGAPDNSVTGAVGGNITIDAGGTLALSTYSDGDDCGDDCTDGATSGATTFIGNASGSGPVTGNVTLVADELDDGDAEDGGFNRIITADIANGDITIGQTDSENTITVDNDLLYNSAHNLTLLSGGNIEILANVQNAGSGAITLVAGWDGVSVDPTQVGAAGTYGNNSGSVDVGTSAASGATSVGSAGGTLDIFADTLNLSASNGNAQVGYHGAGGGDINVKVTGDINAFGDTSDNAYSAQLGNGSLANDVAGNVTGNIYLDAGGQTAFVSQSGKSWLGNSASTGFKQAGNVTSLSTTGSYDSDFLEADLGTSADTGGDVFIGFRNNAGQVGFRIGGVIYDSPHDFVFATGSSLDVLGAVVNNGTGDVTLVAGWDGVTIGSGAQIRAAHAYGLGGAVMNVGGDYTYTIGSGDDAFTFSNNQFDNVTIGSAGGLTSVLTGDLNIAPASGYFAQVGYHGTGGGDIVVAATGNLTMTGGGDAHDYAMIGNGSLNGDVGGNATGNIDVEITGTTSLNAGEGGGPDWIGNVAGSGAAESGTVRLVTADFAAADNLGAFLASDLSGGDVTLGITDAQAESVLSDPFSYNSAHTLDVLTAGSITIASAVQNAGSGAINIVAGWDGTTFDASHFGDAGVHGNNGGSVTIADGAVGSQGGATNVYADDVTLSAVDLYAQLGYHGGGTGTVDVDAAGTLTLTGGAAAANVAQIGSGTAAGSNVVIDAAAVAATGTTSITGYDVSLTAQSGDLGASGAPVDVSVADALTADTQGGDAFLAAPGGALSIGGINLDGGALTLSAGGPINQTGAIHTAALDISTSSGAIFLTNTGNSFGPLTVTTHGTDNAALTDANALTVAGAEVGGTLALTTSGAFTQTGAIAAASLVATSTGGAITLTNAGNAVGGVSLDTANGFGATFSDGQAYGVAGSVGGMLTLVGTGTIRENGALSADGLSVTTAGGDIRLDNAGNAITGTVTLSASGNATLDDTNAITLGTGTAGGALVLAAGGPITQSGAIDAGSLNVSTTSGAITLTDAANTFGALTVSTQGSDGATLLDTRHLTVAGATVGGALALTGPSGIDQTGAIHAGSLSVTATGGAIALTSSGNSFATLAVSTTAGNDAAVTDSAGVAVGATVGGKLTLAAGGAVTQTGPLTAASLSVATSSGDITLLNAANDVSGLVQLSGPGAARFADAVTTKVGDTNVAGNLTLLSKGDIDVLGASQDAGGNVTVVAGWDGTTTTAADLGNSGVFGNNGGSVVIGGANASGTAGLGSASGTTAVYADNVSVLGTNGAAQLGYHGAGGGAIDVVALGSLTVTGGAGAAMVGNGSLGTDVTGAATGDITVQVAGVATFTEGSGGQSWLGNASSGGETGNLVFVASDVDSSKNGRLGDFVQADIVGGDVTLGFTGTQDEGPAGAYSFNSSHTLSLLVAGNLDVTGAVQNAGTGAIDLVAGWDGHTLSPSSFGTAGVSGNDGKGVLIGGANATGAAAIGSAGGTTSVYGASLTVTAANGYAQLGFDGHGSGAIVVDTTGAVTLTGGANAGEFAQIGNGGLKGTGDNHGDIAITAGGDVVLTAGGGSEAYAQIGQGGAESNTGSSGYQDVAAITVNAVNVTLDGGAGAAAYAMIGNGGYKSGLDLAGQAANGGDITVDATGAVTLLGGGGDAFVQIGNGGSQSNLDAAATSGGTDSGDVIVDAPNSKGGGLALTAGTGANAYAQIGNGGYAVNSGPSATAANFTVSGDVTVTDLALTGGAGANGYSQIGNGDASKTGFGDISGDIVIDADGEITYTNGAGTNAFATIGNFTGQGTVGGTLTGATPPGNGGTPVASDPVVVGVVVTDTANDKPNGQNPITTINTVVVTTAPDDSGGAAALAAHIENPPPGPLALLDDKNVDSEPPTTADSATVVIADSLDGAKKAGATQTILSGMLRQTAPTTAQHAIHAVPPADQDFSSWGNEALWQ